MSLILNIDTATETAEVNIAEDGIVLQSSSNFLQKDHAGFLQTAIQQLLQSASISLPDINAIAVTAGPGSYTGIRVGMASAKGLCYALKKPLIAINTLEVLAVTAKQQDNSKGGLLFCPMIDARRMEVFTAIYNDQLKAILDPCAMILGSNSFLDILNKDKIIFLGSGAAKWKKMCSHPNASFTDVSDLIGAMSNLSYSYFLQNRFSNLAYSQPFYLKEFQDNI